MKIAVFRRIAATMIAIAGFALCLSTHASTFTVTNSTSGSTTTFTVTRTGEGTNSVETVLYRTVPRSAFPGQHYTEKSGTLTFIPGMTSTNISITTRTPSNDAYKYQNGTSRSYHFEITDEGGFPITNKVRNITTGTSVNGSNAFGSKNLPINTGTITVTDGGYDQAYHSATVSSYFTAAAPKDYLIAAGAQLRATITFHAREKDDGYQYIAIYANTPTSDIDTGAKDGNPGTISSSRYMAGFTIANDLATGFGRSPIMEEAIDYGEGDPSFATDKTTGLVTQSVTATFDVSTVTSKFFKAAIEVPIPNESEEQCEEPNE